MKRNALRIGRAARLAAGALTVLALAGACASSDSGTGSGSGGSTPSTPAAATSSPALPAGNPSSQPEPAGNGCKPNKGKIPAGAHKVTTADVDLDGDSDTLWMADSGGKRLVGVQTATGATFSTAFQYAGPSAGVAMAQKMAPAGPAIILVNLSRAVQLFDVVDCQIVPTKNVQGQQYTFDLGFGDYGTGLECTRNGDGYTLAGLLATNTKTGWTVTRTEVNLNDFGKTATNGTKTTLAKNASINDAVVKRAQSVSCGGAATVSEPES